MIFPSQEEIIQANRVLISISETDVFFEPDNLLFPEKLDWVLCAIQNPIFGINMYPTIIDKAAILSWTINNGHVFYNANKRTSTFILIQYLHANGYELIADNQELIDVAIKISDPTNYSYTLNDYKDFLFEHIQPITPRFFVNLIV